MLQAWGDGATCPCTHCSTPLDHEHLEADRIIPGGGYDRFNVQPSCRECNAQRGDDELWVGPNPSGIEHPLAHIDLEALLAS